MRGSVGARRTLALALAAAMAAACQAPARGAGTSPMPRPARPAAQGARLVSAGAPTTAGCLRHLKRRCYQPAQIERAYGLPALYRRGLDGRGRTIAIVVSYGSPTIASDLRVFDHEFGLPAARLTVVEPAGPVPAYDGSDPNRVSAAAETSLDVEWAHAVAPGAALLVVATPTFEGEGTSGFPEIVAAERTVIDRGMADVINESFGATEQTFPSPAAILGLRGAEQDAARLGVSVVAASGDQGAGGLTKDARGVYPFPAVIWPASDPLVTAVGGTFVDLDSAGRRLEPDSVWQSPPGGGRLGASGGGLSTVFPRPAFQDGVASVVKGRRGIPDLSLSAAYEGSVDVYDTAPGGARGWQLLYGTSEAAPLFSGMVAIADQLAGRRLGEISPLLYRLATEHEPGIVDVTRGENSLDFRSPAGAPVAVRGFPAAPGYDLASGLGTADAALLVPELAGAVTAGPSVD